MLNDRNMHFKMILTTTLIMAISALVACSENGKMDVPVNDWPWSDDEEVVTPDPGPEMPSESDPAYVDAGWVNVEDTFGSLPGYINVYKSPAELESKSVVAYIAVADMMKAEWDVWSVKADKDYKTTDSYRTPSEVYAETQSPVIINGGYFYYSGGNYTSSLAVSGGVVYAYNINYASEDWVDIYYPTRAVFMETEDGDFDACYSYWNGSVNYIYQIPAENSYSQDPKQQPSASYPEKASSFSAETAIGGGPVLINSGELVNTWSEEMFDVGGVNPTSNQPRTALGITSDNKLIFFVCEGRNMTPGVAGLTTQDVANVLLDLGCVEAINLDGGGSSCMLVNGQETIKVSGSTQRSVASTVMIK